VYNFIDPRHRRRSTYVDS